MELSNRQIIGNIGLFYASYQLSLHGFYALPTVRNSKGPDLLIYNDNEMAGIQVKALSKTNDIIIGKYSCNRENVRYWIVVFNCLAKGIGCLAVPFKDIREGIDKCKGWINSYENLIVCDYPKEDGTINNFWINRKMFNSGSKYYNAWDIITV